AGTRCARNSHRDRRVGSGTLHGRSERVALAVVELDRVPAVVDDAVGRAARAIGGEVELVVVGVVGDLDAGGAAGIIVRGGAEDHRVARDGAGVDVEACAVVALGTGGVVGDEGV